MSKLIDFLKWLKSYVILFIRNGRKPSFAVNNEKILICGNGPSSKDIDFDYYIGEGYELLCVNYFAIQNDRFRSLKPKYYCCVDPNFYKEKNSEENVKLFDELNNVDWELTFICSEGVKLNFDNSNISVVYVNCAHYEGQLPSYAYKLFSKNKATCGYQNVVCAALFFAITSRSQQILLTGIETDMHNELYVDEKNDVYRNLVHFYGDKKIKLTGTEIDKGELYYYFLWQYKILYQYHVLSDYAKYLDVDVKNLCLRSFVDSFEKIDPHNKVNVEEE